MQVVRQHERYERRINGQHGSFRVACDGHAVEGRGAHGAEQAERAGQQHGYVVEVPHDGNKVVVAGLVFQRDDEQPGDAQGGVGLQVACDERVRAAQVDGEAPGRQQGGHGQHEARRARCAGGHAVQARRGEGARRLQHGEHHAQHGARDGARNQHAFAVDIHGRLPLPLARFGSLYALDSALALGSQSRAAGC